MLFGLDYGWMEFATKPDTAKTVVNKISSMLLVRSEVLI
jgi:hypothetical protein